VRVPLLLDSTEALLVPHNITIYLVQVRPASIFIEKKQTLDPSMQAVLRDMLQTRRDWAAFKPMDDEMVCERLACEAHA